MDGALNDSYNLQTISKNCKKGEIIVPLKKSASKEAFRANVKAEINANKKPAQAVAIAYAMKREATKGKMKK
jgi:hypothetical protein